MSKAQLYLSINLKVTKNQKKYNKIVTYSEWEAQGKRSKQKSK